MRVKVRLEGAEDIARKFRAMGAALQREVLIPIMEERLEPMAAEMRANADRRSGSLADGITVGTELSPAQAASNEPIAPIEVYAGPGPDPAAIQEEFGNYRQAPDPFIRPAFDANVKTAMRAIGEDGIDAILQAGKKG